MEESRRIKSHKQIRASVMNLLLKASVFPRSLWNMRQRREYRINKYIV